MRAPFSLHRALSLVFGLVLTVPAQAEVTTTVSTSAGMAHRLTAGGDGRLLLQQGFAFDLSGWLIGAQTAQVLGAGARVLRFGGEFGYRFGFFDRTLTIAPTLTAGYAQLDSTEPNVTGSLRGAHGEVAVEIRLALMDEVYLIARPGVGGSIYRSELREPWTAMTAGLSVDF